MTRISYSSESQEMPRVERFATRYTYFIISLSRLTLAQPAAVKTLKSKLDDETEVATLKLTRLPKTPGNWQSRASTYFAGPIRAARPTKA